MAPSDPLADAAPSPDAPDGAGVAPPPAASVSWRRRWLRWRLDLALLLACLLLPGGLFLLETLADRANALDQGRWSLENTATLLEKHAHGVFVTHTLVLDLLDAQIRDVPWERLEASASLRDQMGGLVRDYPQIGALTLIDARGNIRVSTVALPSPAPNFADRDFFVRLRARNGGVVIGQRVRSRLGESEVVNIARRRTAPDGAFDGVLVANIRLDQAFVGFWSRMPPGTVTALLRDDGRFLARHPAPEDGILRARVTGPIFEAAVAGAPQFAAAVSPLDGRERLSAFRRVEGFPVVVVHGATRATLLEPWRRQMAREAAVFGCTTLALAALALATVRRGRREARVARQLSLRTDDLRSEVERRAKAEANLGEVMLGLVERQEGDRKRIAQDLHDGLGQHVALLHLNVDAVGRAPHDAALVRSRMEDQKAIATEIGQEVNRIAWELRPVWLQGMGLEGVLRTLTHVIAARSGLDIALDLNLGDRRFGDRVETVVYRAIQEATTNAIKHARARHVDIVLDLHGNELRVVVGDDGTGFPAPSAGETGETPVRPSGGLGLRGLRERLAVVGGTLTIDSVPGEGTALIIAIPV